MTQDRLINAIFDLRHAITEERYRLNHVADALFTIGMVDLAKRIISGQGELERMAKEVVDAHGSELSGRIKDGEALMSNMLTALIDRATPKESTT